VLDIESGDEEEKDEELKDDEWELIYP